VTAPRTNVRLFGGTCPDCERYLWTYLEHESGENVVPGVLLRCSECQRTTYARPVRSHAIRRDPPWMVDSEQVIERFDHNMADRPGDEQTAGTATEGGELS
jgi:hypothetical protein